jgi:xanthine dehydrogenase accessory factor
MDQPAIFGFLADKLGAGKGCVLVTVLAVKGSAMRGTGSHMAVSEDGSFNGSLSGGCIEQAVVAEALETLKAGAPRKVRFGAGSPYIDIRLPCGGGMDIHLQPLADTRVVEQFLEAIRERRPFSIAITQDEIEFVDGWHDQTWNDNAGTGIFGHWPTPRLVLAGHGACMTALARLAKAVDLDVHALTPDDRLMAELDSVGVATTRLRHLADTDHLRSDPWTAIAFLFHDHDWEIALMRRALALPHFYIGAMGGRRAHAARRSALIAAGVSAGCIDRIRAPIGLFHAVRDPNSLAVATLSEIMRDYGQAKFADINA